MTGLDPAMTSRSRCEDHSKNTAANFNLTAVFRLGEIHISHVIDAWRESIGSDRQSDHNVSRETFWSD